MGKKNKKKLSKGTLIGGCMAVGAGLGAIGGAYLASTKRGKKADAELSHALKKMAKNKSKNYPDIW